MAQTIETLAPSDSAQICGIWNERAPLLYSNMGYKIIDTSNAYLKNLEK